MPFKILRLSGKESERIGVYHTNRAVHSGAGGGVGGVQLPPPERLNIFFFSHIIFDFAGLFLVAILV